MKLRKPCVEHDRYEKHPRPGATPTMILGSAGMIFADEDWCPGGVFLSDDTLVIEKENGEWPDWVLAELNEPPLWVYNRFAQLVTLSATVLLNGLVETALSVREAE